MLGATKQYKQQQYKWNMESYSRVAFVPVFFFSCSTLSFVTSITVVAYSSSLIPIVQMRKLRLRKRAISRKVLSVALLWITFLLPQQRPSVGEDQLTPFPVHPTGLFLMKDQLNHLPAPPPFFFFRPKSLCLILGSKAILFFPQLIPSCALSIENSSSSAGNYPREKSHLFLGRFICSFHTGPVFNTWMALFSSACPLKLQFSMPPAPTHTPHPDSYPFHDFIPCTVGNGSFNPDCADKANSSSLPGATGFTNTSMQASSTRI